MKRRTFLTGLGASVSLAPGFAFAPAREEAAAHPALTKINPKFMVSPKEVHDWHVVKDSKGGPNHGRKPVLEKLCRVRRKELARSRRD